jgi:N6-adenosine-specific RNA methylase IME4/ParB-like chromosome segregation protein Spo0J
MISVHGSAEEAALAGQLPIDQITVRLPRLRAIREEVVLQLMQSMGELGQLQPVLVDESGELIFGGHRLEAAKRLGWSTIVGVIAEDRSANLLRLRAIDENLIRADLTPAERAAHHAERKHLYEIEHPETRNGATGGGHDQLRKNSEAAPRYSTDAAHNLKVSERTVQLEVARGEIEEVATLAGTSLDTAGELDALVKLPVDEQRRLMDRARSGERVSAKTAAKNQKRAAREAALAARTKAVSSELGAKRYGVIYADPPWRFEPWSRETGMDRAADNHYPTMTTEEICALPIPAADDCVLFLWATPPMLVEALEVMRRWGFQYRSHCIWSKKHLGTGYWFRAVHELLLVGTKGDVPAPATDGRYRSLIEATRTRHSTKPIVFAEMIVSLFPTLPRLDMFARTVRQGWDSWGNEVSASDATA